MGNLGGTTMGTHRTIGVGLALLVLINSFQPLQGMGSLPDASQEGLLSQFTSYASLAIFHYTVPKEVTRATWEFASFQDRPDCPSREVHIHVQHGSYPVFSGDNSSFPESFYLERSSLAHLTTDSHFQPDNSAVHAIYNPLPGSWFAVAYLAPFDEKYGLKKKCRYSLGSIALWSRAEAVETISPNEVLTFRTKRHFSYYKFHVSDDVDAFKLGVANCIVKVRQARPNQVKDACIDFVGIREGGLPFFSPNNSNGYSNVTSKQNITFYESRPQKSKTYYMLVVSQGQVTFDVTLSLKSCGEMGLYGRHQREWYLSERGLIWSELFNESLPKEPTTGFQLFATRPHLSILNETDKLNNFKFENITWSEDDLKSLSDSCLSSFEFNRIDNVNEFTVSYLLQGRSWYTKWLTVLEKSPVMTRFETLEFIDIGGFVNIHLRMDGKKRNNYMVQSILGCLSKDRAPNMTACNVSSQIEVSTRNQSTMTALKVIPFPEPGQWYLGFQVRCSSHKKQSEIVSCPKSLNSAMVSVDLHIQPCDYRPLRDICGSHGLCTKATKGQFRFSSCTCLNGYKGWTCDDSSRTDPSWKYVFHTLLLTLSNFAFLPAIVLALYYGLYTESLIYLATMIFSLFYHTCDQEALTMKLPHALEKVCLDLYINREVLQFCDFYCATLSFWITIISLSKLPYKLVNFLNIFGVLLVAVLVQYNRTGVSVFAIPIPLGILVLLISLVVKSGQRGKLFRPNRLCLALFLPAFTCAAIALILFGLIETQVNYPYVHSTWHVLMALALVFLIPRCRDPEQGHSRKMPIVPENCAPEDSELGCSSIQSASPSEESNGSSTNQEDLDLESSENDSTQGGPPPIVDACS
ncbi:uncharacterized protein LOC131880099 [Tigriopus californicus]|nr:uncharacterized protein LOC131880099 [Tigriopus californicus]